jgi:hypothetical protein
MATSGGPNIVTDGLVLHLDAGSTKSYPGSGTTWYDLSGNGNTGTLINGATYNQSGFYDLDGVGDYINVSFTESNISWSAGFSWSTYVYINNLDNAYTGFMSTYVGPAGTATALKVLNSKFEFRSYGLEKITSSPNLLPLNSWIMLTAVWNPAGNYQLYENGELVQSSTAITSYTPSPGTSLKLGGGAYSMGAAADLNGRFAVAQIYNRALTPEEVLQNYNATKSRFNL